MDRDDFQEDCAFSIIYSDSFETLNLVAYSPDEANIWVTGLRCLVDSEKGKNACTLYVWQPHLFFLTLVSRGAFYLTKTSSLNLFCGKFQQRVEQISPQKFSLHSIFLLEFSELEWMNEWTFFIIDDVGSGHPVSWASGSCIMCSTNWKN